ncbi:hypothetical protein GGX14DRAFT_664467 [Mycena pura]|uniref:Uncharacterized protein n=1 Tax=Mycena pura TaxID=153505 RepID=A0AAD6YLI3_9AGAR|nr:hypothetical protein GGX14DRAFT_664467 [Mycena pura]
MALFLPLQYIAHGAFLAILLMELNNALGEGGCDAARRAELCYRLLSVAKGGFSDEALKMLDIDVELLTTKAEAAPSGTAEGTPAPLAPPDRPCLSSVDIGGFPATSVYHAGLPLGPGGRAVYAATMTYKGEQTEVVVNFAERYEKEAHEMMAASNAAPKLLCCKLEPRVQILIIITSFVKQGETELTLGGAQKLASALRVFHEAG